LERQKTTQGQRNTTAGKKITPKQRKGELQEATTDWAFSNGQSGPWEIYGRRNQIRPWVDRGKTEGDMGKLQVSNGGTETNLKSDKNKKILRERWFESRGGVNSWLHETGSLKSKKREIN